MAVTPATDHRHQQDVRAQVAQDFATCAAYFALVSQFLADAGEAESAAGYERARDAAMDQATLASLVDRTPDEAEGLVAEQHRQARADLFADLDPGYTQHGMQ